jgi:hypothetical protein
MIPNTPIEFLYWFLAALVGGFGWGLGNFVVGRVLR